MIDKNIITKLRALDIESVAEDLDMHVSHHKTTCPFHDDTRPSLTFNRNKNNYCCYVCGARGGGPIDLVEKVLNLGFTDACKWIGNKNGIYFDDDQKSSRWNSIKPTPKKPSHKPMTETQPSVDVRHLSMLVATPVLNAEARKFLFDERKLEPVVIEKLGISSISCPVPMSGDLNGSWFNAPSLLIPYKDLDGNLLSVQARYLGESDGDSHSKKPSQSPKPRFQFPKGSHCSIFNLPALKNASPEEPVFVTEGVSDCLAMLSAGFTSIAIPSATLLKPDDVKLLQGRKLHMYPDRDAPGERLFLELRDMCPNIVRHQLRDGFKDIGQYYAYIHNNYKHS